MTDPIFYFAYGSNLHTPQMQARCPDCVVEQPALLADYRLAFRGHSKRWGGASATILSAPGQAVPGLLYRLSAADLAKLDGFESYPTVYDRLPIEVQARDGQRLVALTYRRHDGGAGAPSLRYVRQIWRGAHAQGLDGAALLAAIEEALGEDEPAQGRAARDGA